MSAIATWGALAASAANILFGAMSDRTWARSRTRRPWITAGFIGTLAAYIAIHSSTEPQDLILAVIALQVAINMLLGPLVAVMADEVPDRQKGRVAALLAIAHPLASLSGALLVIPAASEGQRYFVLCMLISAALLPFSALFREKGAGARVEASTVPLRRSANYFLVWLARLLVQTAGVTVSTYVFLFLMSAGRSFGPAPFNMTNDQFIASLIASATLVAVGVTLGAGRLSDFSGRRRPFIALAALTMTIALPTLATAGSWSMAAFAYGLFVSGYSIFIALHSAFAMETLPAPRHRARDLGILNLTNTIPALIVPLVILTRGQALAPIFAFLGLVTAGGGLIMMFARRDLSPPGA
nr:MFS transporter [Allosphingosinicella vermicomposti]